MLIKFIFQTLNFTAFSSKNSSSRFQFGLATKLICGRRLNDEAKFTFLGLVKFWFPRKNFGVTLLQLAKENLKKLLLESLSFEYLGFRFSLLCDHLLKFNIKTKLTQRYQEKITNERN